MSKLELKYFVLKPKSKVASNLYAKASRQALRAYADSIKPENNELAFDLKCWANNEELAGTLLH